MKNGAAVCGGYAGYGEPVPDERDPAAHVTTLDGEDAAYHVVVGADDAILDGFTVTGGLANGADDDGFGAGMFNDCVYGLKVTECTFSGNTADSLGGGMRNHGSFITVCDCAFIVNTSSWGDGGGIHNRNSLSILTSCAFWGNSAVRGGGVANEYSSPPLTDCTFSGNTATLDGGGVYNWWYSWPTLSNCVFSGNTASSCGGGIHDDDLCASTVANCTFSGNDAGVRGGAISCWRSPGLSATNVVLWGNTAPAGPEIYDGGTPRTVTYSNIQGGYAGTGNIDADPLFVDADGADNVVGTPDDDLRLSTGSPCIDAADGDAAPPLDKDGLLRHDDPAVEPNTGVGAITYADMGAYEHQP